MQVLTRPPPSSLFSGRQVYSPCCYVRSGAGGKIRGPFDHLWPEGAAPSLMQVKIACSAAARPATPTPMTRPAGIDARLLLIGKRCIKSVKGGAHGLDRLLHGIEPLFHQLKPPGSTGRKLARAGCSDDLGSFCLCTPHIVELGV